MDEKHDHDDNLRPHTISRRRFLCLAAAGTVGLLMGCEAPQQSTSTSVPSEAAEPTAPAATSPPSTQAPAPTQEPAEDLPALLGHLHWLGHSSFRLDGPPTIYFDPVGLHGDPPPADIILISHGHDDHFSSHAMGLISGPETIIITTPEVSGRIEGTGAVYAEMHAVQPGERVTVGEVEIETVPAYNIDKSYHPQSAGHLGFIVTLQGERLYFAGDTDHIPEMADIDCDIALLPIGGTYTMDAEEAAQAAADIGPKVAVPMHVRSANPEEFRDLCDCPVVLMEIE